jgi:hypothetical protein
MSVVQYLAEDFLLHQRNEDLNLPDPTKDKSLQDS